VKLVDLLDHSRALEERAAALYRRFATAQFEDPELAGLWTALAADEDAHARSIREARRLLTLRESELTAVEGCEAAVADIAERLRHAELLGPDATLDRQLAAALDLELSELEAIRRVCLQASGCPVHAEHAHLHHLADMAMRRSRDDHVRLGAALLLARYRLTADAMR
jgi:rubrerythrin